MAIDTINIGSAPNDGTGDPLRTAFNKTNTNFLNITEDGGDEITVLNPTTSTDTTLNVALQDVFDAGGGGAVSSVNGQTGAVSIDLESVLTEGGTATDLQFTIQNSIDDNKVSIDPYNGDINCVNTATGEAIVINRELIRRVKGGFGTELTFTDPTANRVITFKDESGTVAFLSDVTTPNLQEVLNAGSTASDVDINLSYTGSDYRMMINGDQLLNYDINTNESISIIPPFIAVNGVSDNLLIKSNKLEFLDGGFKTEITRTDPTANRIINFKDESGTVAYLSDISGVGATQNARATRLELTNNISLPISPTGSVTVIDFDNTIFNVDPTVFTNNGAGTVTCTLAGNYLVTTSIVLESPLASAITKSELGIRKNGSTVVCATTDDTPIALGNNIRSLTTSTIINLAANDTLQAVVNLFGASATGQALRLPTLFGTTATQVSNISIERLEVSEFDVDAVPTDGSANAVSSNGVFDALALKQDKVTGVSDTEIGYLDGVTSAIQTQLNGKQATLTFDTVPTDGSTNPVESNGVFDALATKQVKMIKQGYTQLTGVTGNQVLASLEIPANWIASGDGLEIVVSINKSTTAASIDYRLYHDTTINGTTNTITSNTAVGPSTRVGYLQRILSLNGTTLYNCLTATSSALIPGILTNFSTTTFNPAVTNYITLVVNPTVTSESCGFITFYIRKL